LPTVQVELIIILTSVKMHFEMLRTGWTG